MKSKNKTKKDCKCESQTSNKLNDSKACSAKAETKSCSNRTTSQTKSCS